MPLTPRFFQDDEELSKKDDDHRPQPASSTAWKPAAPRMRKRRLVAFILSLGVLYLFFKNMPQGLPPLPDRYDRRVPGRRISGIPLKEGKPPNFEETKPKPQPPKEISNKLEEEEEGDAAHFYDGPLAFGSLAKSLQGLARGLRFSSRNRHVLFAAATPESASRLIPLACEMARWGRNVVHFAYMGRDEIPMLDLKYLNGVGPDCEANWHDARPDFSQFSTDDRMHSAVEGALNHITIFMRPHIYISEDPTLEEAPFALEYRTKAAKEGKVLIELPQDASERLMWMTRLDTGSLSAWHNTYVEIVIEAPSGSGGSFMRLLESIGEADYFGVRYPHIAINIPGDIDAPTLHFLDRIRWPPISSDGTPHTSRLSFHRRTSSIPLTPLESSMRTVESFYPTVPLDSHVLILSPDVELSPMYFHYLFFNLLEYRYSLYNTGTLQSDSLAGISLITPSSHFDTQAPFHPPPPLPPAKTESVIGKVPLEGNEPTPFLWQAPDTTATLYFGNRWLELHSYLSLRISTPTAPTPRLLPPSIPAFAEPLYELMRLRGYTILYPNLPSHSIAITHSTPRTQPEFTNPDPTIGQTSSSPQNFNPYTPYLFTPPSPPPPPPPKPLIPPSSPLTHILPPPADLPELTSLPLLSSSGTLISATDFARSALSESATFRYMIGSCPEDVYPAIVPGAADDLFCDADGEPGSGSRPAVPLNEQIRQGIVKGTGNKNEFAPDDDDASSGLGPEGAIAFPGSGTGEGMDVELDSITQAQSETNPSDPKSAAAGGVQGIGGLGSPGAAMAAPLPRPAAGSTGNVFGDAVGRAQGQGQGRRIQKEVDAQTGMVVDEEGKRMLDVEFRGHLERQGVGKGEEGNEGKGEGERKMTPAD